jgi:hypothetical protein
MLGRAMIVGKRDGNTSIRHISTKRQVRSFNSKGFSFTRRTNGRRTVGIRHGRLLEPKNEKITDGQIDKFDLGVQRSTSIRVPLRLGQIDHRFISIVNFCFNSFNQSRFRSID